MRYAAGARYVAWALAGACALALVLLQCGASGGSPAGPAGGRGFNATDVMFLQMMVPHQAQGVRLVRIARERPVRPEVATLAAAIESTQLSEIQRMAARLRAWKRPPTASAHEHAAHGGMPETTDAELKALARAPGGRFEREFLNLRSAHQDDAVQLARMETGGGRDLWTRSLAARVDRSRSAQITRMLAMLGGHVHDSRPRR
jgi:uncharacterized protein (DUF305 family)